MRIRFESIAAALLFPVLAVSAVSVVPAGRAASWVWPVSFAEAKLVGEYQAADPWALRDAQEQLAADLRAGWPETSARIRHDRQDVVTARRAASPRWAHCRGVGPDDGGGYFARFHCTMRLRGLSDWEATRKVTLYVRGRQAFRTANGWH